MVLHSWEDCFFWQDYSRDRREVRNTKSSSRVKILVYLWVSNYCSWSACLTAIRNNNGEFLKQHENHAVRCNIVGCTPWPNSRIYCCRDVHFNSCMNRNTCKISLKRVTSVLVCSCFFSFPCTHTQFAWFQGSLLPTNTALATFSIVEIFSLR